MYLGFIIAKRIYYYTDVLRIYYYTDVLKNHKLINIFKIVENGSSFKPIVY